MTTSASSDRLLDIAQIEGEIGVVIDYVPGQSKALDVLGGAMALVASLDALDRALLSSVDTELEPVSILNDVQHSSLKLLLARWVKKVPDEHIKSMDWKKWVGAVLVQGKYKLLSKLEADAPEIAKEIESLADVYKRPPQALIGYTPPKVATVQNALREVRLAREQLAPCQITIQTDLGDVALGVGAATEPPAEVAPPSTIERTNRSREFVKVRYPDMIGDAQWTVLRAGKLARVDVLHQQWLQEFHARRVVLLPGDSLDCTFDETVTYDQDLVEVARKISIIEIHAIHPPAKQGHLGLDPMAG